MKGKNTGLKLIELLHLRTAMMGDFDFDGQDPEIALRDVNEDIEQLSMPKPKRKRSVKVKGKIKLW